MSWQARCLSFVLSFGLLSTSLSILFSSNTLAQSQYDSNYQTTDTVTMKLNQGSNSAYKCEQDIDLTVDWSTYILDSNKWLPSGTQTWQSAKNSFEQAINNNGQWGVTQRVGFGGSEGQDNKDVLVYWTTDNSMSLNWDWTPNGVTAYSDTGNFNYALISCGKNNGATDSNPYLTAYYSGGYSTLISTSDSDVFNPYGSYSRNLFINMDANKHNIPIGYEGEPLRDSIDPFSNKLHPKVIYSVDKWNLRAIYLRNLPMPTHDSYNIKWTLYDHDSTDVLKEQNDTAFIPFTYEFDEFGTYGLDVSFEPKGIPYAPLPDDITYETLKLKIRIDGNSYYSDDKQDNCDSDGNCEVSSALEDCSVYESSFAGVIGGFGCHIRNFGVHLRTMFLALFVPSPSHITDSFSALTSEFNSTLGFLAYPITWVYNFFSAFNPDNAQAINTCNWSFGNVFNGGQFKLNFCSFSQNFPSAWTTAQTFIQAFTVFILLAGLYQEYRRVLNT